MRIKKVSQVAGLIGSVVNSQSSSNKDTYSCKTINEKTGIVLWENESPTSSFSAQEVTFTSDSYVFYEVIFRITASNDYCMSTKFINGQKSVLAFPNATGIAETRSRNITATTNGSITFGNSQNMGGTTYNDTVIPVMIIGYK